MKRYLYFIIFVALLGSLMFGFETGELFYYSTDIIRDDGFSGEAALFNSVLICIINLVFTIIGMALIDKFGRNILFYVGGFGMPVFLGLFSSAYISGNTHSYILLVFLIGFIGFFAALQGTVIWVILSEMFPNNLRTQGAAIGSFFHWFFNFIISLFFPIAVSSFGVGFVFMYFGVATVLSLIFYRAALVETKGKSLEEIEKLVLNKKEMVVQIIPKKLTNCAQGQL